MNGHLPTNRLLWSVTLLTLVCTLINVALLWRGMRSAASQAVAPAHLSDDQFSRIQTFVEAVKADYAAQKQPEASLLLAEDLLNNAHYMHDDIGPEEWHRKHLTAEPKLSRLILRRYQALGQPEEGFSYYKDFLSTLR